MISPIPLFLYVIEFWLEIIVLSLRLLDCTFTIAIARQYICNSPDNLNSFQQVRS